MVCSKPRLRVLDFLSLAKVPETLEGQIKLALQIVCVAKIIGVAQCHPCLTKAAAKEGSNGFGAGWANLPRKCSTYLSKASYSIH